MQHMRALLTKVHQHYQLSFRRNVREQQDMYGFISDKIITHLLQFWKYVKYRFLVVRQGHMVLTAQEHAAIVKIVRHVISMMENVIITVVLNLDINHLVVENVNQNFTAMTVAYVAVCIVKDFLVTVLLENV